MILIAANYNEGLEQRSHTSGRISLLHLCTSDQMLAEKTFTRHAFNLKIQYNLF